MNRGRMWLGKASSRNLCSSAGHGPSACRSWEQLIASALHRRGGKAQPAQGHLPGALGALAWAVRVQRTEQSWRAGKARTALGSVLNVLPQKELSGWGTTPFSARERWRAVIPHVLSWATSCKLTCFPSDCPVLLVHTSCQSFSAVNVSGCYTAWKLALETSGTILSFLSELPSKLFLLNFGSCAPATAVSPGKPTREQAELLSSQRLGIAHAHVAARWVLCAAYWQFCKVGRKAKNSGPVSNSIRWDYERWGFFVYWTLSMLGGERAAWKNFHSGDGWNTQKLPIFVGREKSNVIPLHLQENPVGMQAGEKFKRIKFPCWSLLPLNTTQLQRNFLWKFQVVYVALKCEFFKGS